MLEKILQQEQCLIDTQTKSKKAILEKLSRLLGDGLDHINSHDILQGLLEREKLGSTSIGHGVALPHARLKQINTPIGAFIKVDQTIDFSSDEPVDLVFALIVPTDVQETHLKLLAGIANIFNDDERRKTLRGLHNNQQLWQQLIKFDTAVNHVDI